MEVLREQFEKCDAVRASLEKHKKAPSGSEAEKESLVFKTLGVVIIQSNFTNNVPPIDFMIATGSNWTQGFVRRLRTKRSPPRLRASAS